MAPVEELPNGVNQSMKLIVIKDSDGHLQAIAHTPENVNKAKNAAIAAGFWSEDFGETGLPCGRTFGNICEVIDTEKLAEFPKSNPFM